MFKKQIKETLARLTNKNNKNNKGAKYRRDKRDAAVKREHELMEQEELESKVLKLTEFVTANDLANMMDVSVTEVIGTLHEHRPYGFDQSAPGCGDDQYRG